MTSVEFPRFPLSSEQQPFPELRPDVSNHRYLGTYPIVYRVQFCEIVSSSQRELSVLI